MLVLVGAAAGFGAAFLSRMASSVASKLAKANHPVAVSPQWLLAVTSTGLAPPSSLWPHS